MTDLIYLLLLVVLFGLAYALVPAFGRLMENKPEVRK